ncbi:hypothetical protein SLEP1_g22954 [Rubroshorea leprosula]|uniref:RanBP2-type domain-containing protein n=1 Tax=Rubroshorea leprosula TaxID=152421 RepID=A0AAV5JLR6_9ROSI|nr:hypothetical protein SLEP1_g22954 [Rubroshorea leprosula]
MGSREKDSTTPHQPLLSSLVVRPSASDGGDAGGGRVSGSDYEPGEVRRDPPPYSRSDRYNDEPGYRIRAGSSSPVRRRDADNRHSSDFDRVGGPRSREFGNGRDSGRHRDSSPHHGRGPGGRAAGRGFDGPGFRPGPFKGEGMGRNNPNVQPREGDWICSDPLCGNLNFARREYCNNCQKSRYPPVRSPHRGYPGPPPPHAPPRRFPGPPMDLSPGRAINGFRSPPRGWARDGPRGFGAGAPRHEGRFSDHGVRRDHLDYLEDDYRVRNKFDRPLPMDWGHRDRGRGNFFNERKGYERRPPSPPPPPPIPPQRGRWGRDVRERSRSPIRVGLPKDHRREMYMGRGRGRGREDRRGIVRDRFGDAF